MAREGLLAAYNAGMNNGDFLFVIVELNSIALEAKIRHNFKWFISNYRINKTDSEAVKTMFLHSLILARKIGDLKSREKYEEYTRELKCRKSDLPFFSEIYRSTPRVCVFYDYTFYLPPWYW